MPKAQHSDCNQALFSMKHFFAVLTVLALCAPAQLRAADPKPVRVLVWDEQQPQQKPAYGDKFLGETIAAHLAPPTQSASVERL